MSTPTQPEDSGADGSDETVLGKYRLMAKLGQGGMADVYLALARGALGVNKLVVIKQLRAGLASNPDFVAMFLDEARLAVRLNHPNVVHTYEAGEREGQCFLVMEYLEGQAVDEFMLRARAVGAVVPPGVWVRVVADALSGLHYAHELCDYDGTSLQIAHRDISPQNLFVTYDGVTKVVDFGIAKAKLNSTVTDAGELKGKVCYMAPEHVLGRPSDRRADVFAMGVVLWELLAGGRRLFQGDAAQALQNVLHAPIPPVSSAAPGTPAALEAIVERALRRDPAERYQTADEMRVALEAYLASGDAFVGNDGVGRAMVRVAGDLREKVRRRVQAFMAGVDAPPPSGHGRLPVNSTPVNFARLASVRAGAALPLLMTPSGTVVTSGGPLAPAVARGVAAVPAGRGRRRAGYALVALAAIAGVGSLVALRSSRRPAALGGAAPVAAGAAAAATGAGVVRVLSTPAEAEIEYEGLPLGRTPTAVRLAPGDYALTLRKVGYRDESLVVRVEAGREAESAVSLRPNAPAPEPPSALRPASVVTGRGRRRAPAKAEAVPAPAAAPAPETAAAPKPEAPKPEAPRPKVKLVDEEKRSLRLDE